ncbi:CLEC10A [Branchiostoma lanceolatum]|uniref:CLEC10A protein n=1 Tax=Branchiostoma lanceolatum TaxID=7740 RepID=A0A8K0E898_BRALA|nr:CLEC10A [Branchiostoma lanceolatum]
MQLALLRLERNPNVLIKSKSATYIGYLQRREGVLQSEALKKVSDRHRNHMADLQTVLIAQQAHITRLQNDSKSSELDLQNLLAEQKKIIDSLKERVAQLEERIKDTGSPTTCPAGYQQFQRTCYRFSTDQKPYSEARDTCHGEGGRLATVKTNWTHDFLANHVRATTHANTWIGLSDVETEGVWVWDDGTLLAGEGMWGTGEPNGGTMENCVHIYADKDYRWNDNLCPRSYYYICEVLA